MASVIVFGPTGSVGSVVARAAHEQGAKVYLAMRNTEKDIPGISTEAEKQGDYHRIEADLHKPETLTAAVQAAKAERAFTYLAHGSPDHMRSSLEALKAGGIKFIVMLSSFTISGDPRKVQPQDLISFLHAQVEINLEEIFGPGNFVAARGGAFATNNLRWKTGFTSGDIRVFGSQFPVDNVTPESMGTTCGAILVDGPRGGQQVVYMYGPEITTTKETLLKIAETLGKKVTITEIDATEALDQYEKLGMPPVLAKYFVKVLGEGTEEGKKAWGEGHVRYAEGVQNIEKYTGKKSQSLEDWVRGNRGLFEG